MKLSKCKLKKLFKEKMVESMVIGTTLIVGGSVPANASVLEISGMSDVATSLQNVVKYVGLFFLAGGAITAFYGSYKLFQSIKNQDSDSRSSAILELASGLGAAAVGAAAATFSGYITLAS